MSSARPVSTYVATLLKECPDGLIRRAAAAPTGVACCERLTTTHTIVKAMAMFESQLESQLEQVKKMLKEDNMQHVPLLVFALECIFRETSQSIEEKKQLLLSTLQSSDDSNENGGEWL